MIIFLIRLYRDILTEDPDTFPITFPTGPPCPQPSDTMKLKTNHRPADRSDQSQTERVYTFTRLSFLTPL